MLLCQFILLFSLNLLDMWPMTHLHFFELLHSNLFLGIMSMIFLICTDGPAMDARKPEHLGMDSGFRFFSQGGNGK